MSNVIDLSRELAEMLDRRNKAREAAEQEARPVWEENPRRYENQIIHAVSKLTKLKGYGYGKAMNFLDEIIAGKVRA
jgi:hypothetical protein